MNVPTLFRRILLGAGLALTLAGMAVGAAGAQQAGIATPGQTSIVTDKHTYVVGEPITITYTLPGPGRIRITDLQGAKVSTLRAGYSNQAGSRIHGTVTPPAGKECLKLEYTSSKNQTSTAETSFQVTAKGGAGPQTPAPGLYTLYNMSTDKMLESDAEKKVYSRAADGGPLQKWMIESASDGYVFLRDLGTGYYLQGGEVSPEEGGVGTSVKYDVQGQHWKLEPATDGYFILRDRGTGFALVDAGGTIATFKSAGGATADAKFQWKLTPVQP